MVTKYMPEQGNSDRLNVYLSEIVANVTRPYLDASNVKHNDQVPIRGHARKRLLRFFYPSRTFWGTEMRLLALIVLAVSSLQLSAFYLMRSLEGSSHEINSSNLQFHDPSWMVGKISNYISYKRDQRQVGFSAQSSSDKLHYITITSNGDLPQLPDKSLCYISRDQTLAMGNIATNTAKCLAGDSQHLSIAPRTLTTPVLTPLEGGVGAGSAEELDEAQKKLLADRNRALMEGYINFSPKDFGKGPLVANTVKDNLVADVVPISYVRTRNDGWLEVKDWNLRH